jgi:hypothetical protein
MSPGFALDGRNYLLPVGSDPNSELDVKLGAAIERSPLMR